MKKKRRNKMLKKFSVGEFFKEKNIDFNLI